MTALESYIKSLEDMIINNSFDHIINGVIRSNIDFCKKILPIEKHDLQKEFQRGYQEGYNDAQNLH